MLQTFSSPLEVVLSDHAAYVFIGEPPRKFGLLWIHDGEARGFYRLVEEHGVAPVEIKKALDALSEACVKHQDAERYTATINQCQVVVTVSESLENEVHSIIDGLTR